MADLITMLSAVAGQQGEEVDEDFNQTVLLLHGDGTNGAQNNTFLDSSTNNFTITRNGNTTQGTFSPFSLAAGEWSNYLDGTGDYLTAPSNSAFAFGTGSYTVEAWVYRTATDTNESVVFSAASANGAFNVNILSNGALNVAKYGTGGIVIGSSGDVPLNEWAHIAVVRTSTSSNDTRLYVNGVLKTTGTDAENWTVSSAPIVGGFSNLSTYDFIGYISNLRIVKGSAVYTSAFTPPTAPLTNITNTSLLTCQSNRFVDNSTNAFAITRNGDVRVTPFSPFAPTAAYSAGTNGGSGYFDGSGDYLSIADNSAFEFGSGDFCVEFFAYVVATDTFGIIFVSQWNTPNRGWIFGYVNSGTTLNFDYSTTGSNSVSVNASVSLPLNQWAHFAACRSGNTLSTYMNGSRVATASVTGVTIFAPNQPLEIGRNPEATTTWEMNGYLSGMRIVKGSSVYDPTQTTITVPTAPPTAISNTSVLLNYTNAGIIDNTGKNVLETVGNAQIDTTTKKYGTGSLEFDGTGDYLLLPNNVDQQLGTGNFTIEFWVYLASGDTGSARGLVAKGTSTTGWLVSLDSSQKVVFTYTTSTITSSGAITTNAWNHIAVVRSGTGSNQTKIYIGGTNDGTGTVSTDFNQTESMYVGANRTGGDPMKGFIDDLRITKGVARYTANFTAPTKAFPDQ